jgi:hypothetical protein
MKKITEEIPKFIAMPKVTKEANKVKQDDKTEARQHVECMFFLGYFSDNSEATVDYVHEQFQALDAKAKAAGVQVSDKMIVPGPQFWTPEAHKASMHKIHTEHLGHENAVSDDLTYINDKLINVSSFGFGFRLEDVGRCCGIITSTNELKGFRENSDGLFAVNMDWYEQQKYFKFVQKTLGGVGIRAQGSAAWNLTNLQHEFFKKKRLDEPTVVNFIQDALDEFVGVGVFPYAGVGGGRSHFGLDDSSARSVYGVRALMWV